MTAQESAHTARRYRTAGNQWAQWLRTVTARLGGEAAQGGPDPLGQRRNPPVLIDLQGGTQPGGSLFGRASQPLYLGSFIMDGGPGQR